MASNRIFTQPPPVAKRILRKGQNGMYLLSADRREPLQELVDGLVEVIEQRGNRQASTVEAPVPPSFPGCQSTDSLSSIGTTLSVHSPWPYCRHLGDVADHLPVNHTSGKHSRSAFSTLGYRQFDIARTVDALRRFLEIPGLR